MCVIAHPLLIKRLKERMFERIVKECKDETNKEKHITR